MEIYRSLVAFLSRVTPDIWGLILETSDLTGKIKSEPFIKEVESLKIAADFGLKLAIDPENDYKWVSDYARYNLDRASSILKLLDDKASDIIKNLGGGTGFITLGALAAANRSNVLIIAALTPSFMLALASIYFAMKARGPMATLELPSVSKAIEVVEYHHDRAQAAFLAQWNYTIEGMHETILRKANRVDVAARFYLLAIASLSFPVAFTVGFWWPI